MTSSPTMARKLLMALAAVVSLLPLLARADSPTIVRIGALVPPVLISPEEGMRQGLTELGYREGKNVTIDRRLGETTDALQAGAVDLVRSKVDVIVAFGTSAARAALSATSTIPVVFISGDPVAAGLAASLARPGANATGVSTVSTDLVPKRLELLQQIVPHMQRVILLGNPSTPLHPRVVEEAQLGARALRIQIVAVDARNVDELDAALKRIQRSLGDAVLVSSDVLFLANKERIATAFAKAKMPAIFPWRDFHDAGVLMSYGPNPNDMGRHAAVYVDKILKGAKPANLPIEQLSKYELVIDMRVARAMRLKVPPDFLLRADEVIR